MKNWKPFVLDALIRHLDFLAAYEKDEAFLQMYAEKLRELRRLYAACETEPNEALYPRTAVQNRPIAC